MIAYQQNLSEIFAKQEHPENLFLFRKIILLAREGLLQVNGQFPDASKTLFENLIEGNSFVIDLTQLNPNYRHRLKTWLLDPHQNECSYSFWEGYINNDHRGYTIEVALSWWGRFYNWLFGIVETDYWPLTTKEDLSPEFQLHGFTMQLGKQGWLCEFKSTHLENIFNFNKNAVDLEKARNSRRIILTPDIVEKLIQVETIDDEILNELNEPHPLSINVSAAHKDYRFQSMVEFRKTEFIEESPVWYVSLWQWLFSLVRHTITHISSSFVWGTQNQEALQSKESIPKPAATKHYLFDNGKIRITMQDGVFQVREVWPGYSNLICSGGGGKIFSLVGGYKACWEMGIPFTAYTGSSAGAIMSILAYLNYSPEQVERFFADYNREILLYNEWDKSGFSKTTALKAGLDYVIALKVLEIINYFKIDKTKEGRKFLHEKIFNRGKITFRSLANLKKRYPDCGLGEELIITASNLEAQRTTYFSLATTPDTELSHAGEMSASIPPFFKPPLFSQNNVPHTDGGLTSNFPSEVFIGHDKSFLSSRYGYSIESLGFYFDNGPEEGMLNHFRQKIYRESAISNWIYKKLSGIQDPVSAWEWDRIKMVQQSFTTVLLHSDISSTQFTVPIDQQEKSIKKGYEDTKNHLSYLYTESKSGKGYTPCQLMFENFQSMEAILVHCCFRQNKKLFEQLMPIALQYGVKEERISLLARRFTVPNPRFFQSDNRVTIDSSPSLNMNDFTMNPSIFDMLISRRYMETMRLFISVYPILLRMRKSMFATKKDYEIFCKGRHGTSINNPFYALPHLGKLSTKQHLILYVLIISLKNYHHNNHDEMCLVLENISNAVIAEDLDLNSDKFLNNWSAILNTDEQNIDLLDAISECNWAYLTNLCEENKKTPNSQDVKQTANIDNIKEINAPDRIKSCAY